MEEINLFDIMEKEQEPVKNSMCVFKDGKFVNMDWHEIFDTERFDELRAVTYVSSASFFSSAVRGFKKAVVIIGIEDSEFKSAFSESVKSRLNDEGTKFFEALPDEDKNKVVTKQIDIRYSDIRYLIHSKIYLLSNSITKEKRTVIGSANLTAAAMGKDIKHYEDIVVYDDESAWNEYIKRFDEIYIHTIDFVKENVRKKYVEGKLINLADFTAEEKAKELVETLKDQNIVPIVNEKIIQEIQNELNDKKQYEEKLQITMQIISSAGKKSRKGNYYELKPEGEITQKIVDMLMKTTKEEEILSRFTLTYNDADKKQYVIYPNNNNEQTRDAEVFDRRASTEEIRTSLNNMIDFVSAYKKYTNNPDKNGINLSHIWEIILYSFASTYMFKLRNENPGRKADFPIMMVIGGRAASGKSNLLAYIDGVLSGRKLETNNHFIQYKDIDGKKKLQDLYNSENTYPLLIDEMSPKFFTSTSKHKGEELIKYLSNTLDGKHPVVICTTNTTAFHIPHQVERRIYYIQVNDCFDETKKGKADEFYENIIGNATNILYRDFCYRVGEKIKSGEKLTETGNSDYLLFAREIFVSYFRECGIEVPPFFPKNIFKDYEDRGLNMWKTLFEKRPEDFVLDKKKGTLSVSGKSMENKDLYMNYLRQDLLQEDAGEYIVIRTEEFFKWIGIFGWFDRYKAIRNVSKQKI